MSKQVENYSGGGLGLFTVLGLIFIVLKLVGSIDWPWIWVLAPFWIPIALVLGIVVLTIIIVGIASIFSSNDEEEDDEN